MQRRILTCHAVTAFRRKNFVSRHKGSLDEEQMRLNYANFHFRRDSRARDAADPGAAARAQAQPFRDRIAHAVAAQ